MKERESLQNIIPKAVRLAYLWASWKIESEVNPASGECHEVHFWLRDALNLWGITAIQLPSDFEFAPHSFLCFQRGRKRCLLDAQYLQFVLPEQRAGLPPFILENLSTRDELEKILWGKFSVPSKHHSLWTGPLVNARIIK